VLTVMDGFDEHLEIPKLRVLRKLGEGYFGITFLIQDEAGKTHVFKTARGPHLVPYLRREYDVLRHLTAHPFLGEYLPIPRLWMKAPPGFLMEYVQGKWLKERPLLREDVVHIAEFMGIVHQVDPRALRRMLNVGMPPKPYRRYLLEDFWEARQFFLRVSEYKHREKVAQVIHDVVARLPALERHVKAVVPLFARCALSFVHGDLSPYNVCDTGQGIKVVDWGQCRVEARCADIARTFRWFLLGPEEEEIFWRTYGMHDPGLIERTSAYGPVHAFYSLIYVMDRLRLAPDPEAHTEDIQTYLLKLFESGHRYWDQQKTWLGHW